MTARILGAVAALGLTACYPFAMTPRNLPGSDSKPLPAHEPALVNPAGEAMLWQAAQEWAPSLGNPAPTILRAYIIQDRDWNIARNENTGIITDRWMRAAVLYKGGQTGKCRQWDCQLTEDEAGGTWGRPQLDCPNGAAVAITCDSITPLRASPPPQ